VSATTGTPGCSLSTTAWWSSDRWLLGTRGSRSISTPASLGGAALAHRSAQEAVAAYLEPGLLGDQVKATLARDLFVYGVPANRGLLETLYSAEQGLTPAPVSADELFAGPARDLG
jgi:hypothetical protein